MRVVISIGGSTPVPGLDVRHVEGHVSVVEMLARDGCEIDAVVDGGGIARDYIGTVRDLGANEVQLNQIGIDVTRINARLLIAVFGSQVNPKVAHGYGDAGDVIRCNDISVMGGVMPGRTTGAVAAALAEYVDADLLVYVISVDGIFSANPSSDPDATEFEEVTVAEFVDVIGDIKINVGLSTLVDPLIAKLIEHAKMRVIVLDSTDPGRIASVVLRDKYTGTNITPEGDDEPTCRAP